jgi:hypothetical protein
MNVDEVSMAVLMSVSVFVRMSMRLPGFRGFIQQRSNNLLHHFFGGRIRVIG